MLRNTFLMAALVGLLPGFTYVGKNVAGLAFPQPDTGLKQERLQIVEGSLTEVNPETETIRIETLDGVQWVLRYTERTQVEGMEDTVAGCFGPKNERNVRIQFRTVDGRNMAARIEHLPGET